jgi:hypothetical protein
MTRITAEQAKAAAEALGLNAAKNLGNTGGGKAENGTFSVAFDSTKSPQEQLAAVEILDDYAQTIDLPEILDSDALTLSKYRNQLLADLTPSATASVKAVQTDQGQGPGARIAS